MTALAGKVVVVTGTTLGAGAFAVRALVHAGARVYVAEENAGRLVALIAELGHNHLDGSVSETPSIETLHRAFEQAARRFGTVDAALHAFQLLPPVSPEVDPDVTSLSEDFKLLIAVELLAVMVDFSMTGRPGAVLALTNWPAGETNPPEELRSATLYYLGQVVQTLARRPDANDLRINMLTVLGPGDPASREFPGRVSAGSPGDPTGTFPRALEYLLTEPVTGTIAAVEAVL